MNRILVIHIANRVFDLLRRQKLILDGGDRPVFYVWPQPDRLILLIDPEMIRNQTKILSSEFRHDLSTILAGRRVVQTNSRGIFLQVAYNPPPTPHALRSDPLDLTRQPSALHIPVGTTRSGPFWISLIDADSILVAGRRRMGKSRWIHGAIQALIHGGQAELYLRDGKGGMEFRRYSDHPCVHLAQDNLRQALIDLQIEVNRRQGILSQIGVTSIVEYNELHPDNRMTVLVLVVDEIAHIPDDCRPILSDLIGRCGAYGVYPILGTTYPGHKEIGSLIKANIGMRIALPVPTQSESRVILGVKGAEELPNVKGRMLFEYNARLVEAQSFLIELPDGNSYMGPILAGQELEIAKFAIEGEGVLSIGLLKQSFRLSEWQARKLLDGWQARGWLEKDPESKNARRVTGLLRGVCSQSDHSPQSTQTSQTGEE